MSCNVFSVATLITIIAMPMANASSTVAVVGQVVAHTCSATVNGDVNRTVYLNVIKVAEFPNSTPFPGISPTPFTIEVTGCAPGQVVWPYFTSDHHVAGATGLSNIETGHLAARNVGVMVAQLLNGIPNRIVYNDAEAQQELAVDNEPANPLGNASFIYSASYTKTTRGAAVMPGKVSSSMVYTLVYP